MKKTYQRKVFLNCILSIAVILILNAMVFSNAVAKTIKVGHISTVESSDHYFSMAFKEFIESHAPGQYEVKIYPNAMLGGFRDMIEQCQAGTLPIASSTIGGIAQFFPEIQVFDLPYLFPDQYVAWEIFDLENPIMKEMNQKMIEKLGIRIIGIADTGDFRSFSTTKKVKNTNDLQGLKIRTVPARMPGILVKSLGAKPTPIAWAELYTALQTGVVEGTKNSINDMVDMKFHEVLKYIIMDNHTPTEAFFYMNEKLYQSLSKDMKAIFDNAGNFASQVSRGTNQLTGWKFKKVWLKAGCEIHYPSAEEKAQFVKKAQPVYDWFRKEYGSYWLDKLLKEVDSVKRKLGY